MKRLVVCADGTWKSRDDSGDVTNVEKLHDAVLPVAGDGTRQLARYFPGVGASRKERLLGGAFGLGLSRNVQECYRWLAREWQPGDELFLFGFSRGAFTVRSLAGMIRNVGMLPAGRLDLVDEGVRPLPRRRPRLAGRRRQGGGVAQGPLPRGPAHPLRRRLGHGRRARRPDLRPDRLVDPAALGLPRRPAQRAGRARLPRAGRSTSAASRSPRRCGRPTTRTPTSSTSSRSGSRASTPTSAAATPTAGCPTPRCGGWPARPAPPGSSSTSSSLREATDDDAWQGQLYDSFTRVYRLQGPFVREIGTAPVMVGGRTLRTHESVHTSTLVRHRRLTAPPKGPYAPGNLLAHLSRAYPEQRDGGHERTAARTQGRRRRTPRRPADDRTLPRPSTRPAPRSPTSCAGATCTTSSCSACRAAACRWRRSWRTRSGRRSTSSSCASSACRGSPSSRWARSARAGSSCATSRSCGGSVTSSWRQWWPARPRRWPAAAPACGGDGRRSRSPGAPPSSSTTGWRPARRPGRRARCCAPPAPAGVVLAVPVAPRGTVVEQADELVVVRSPEPFGAVGRWYADFSPTTEQEVVDLLRRGTP